MKSRIYHIIFKKYVLVCLNNITLPLKKREIINFEMKLQERKAQIK